MTADSNENLSTKIFYILLLSSLDVLIKKYYENIWQQTYMSIVGKKEGSGVFKGSLIPQCTP